MMLEINLLPAEQRSTRADLTWMVDKRIYLPTLIFIVVAISSFLFYLTQRDRLTSLEEQVKMVTEEIERERPLLVKIKDLDDKLSIIAQKNLALKSIQVSKKRWVILFENLSSVLPPNTWIISLNQTGDQAIELKGITYDFSEVAEYMVSLERQISFSKVTLLSITNQLQGTEKAYSFTFNCDINPQLGMEEK